MGGKTRRAFVILYARSTSRPRLTSISASASATREKSGPTSMIPSTPNPGRPIVKRVRLFDSEPCLMSVKIMLDRSEEVTYSQARVKAERHVDSRIEYCCKRKFEVARDER